ncbi:uncharacterized protein LOC116252504 [Nymphaea colorata]|nr:uncharacterized protein LOC116252504 [Nymphaea colorata]XP_031482674.1 uncharacterized protein LOC116252504 [Nymphaea colorata]
MSRRQPPPSARPLGTDGSDFSYRMVVDSRYTKVAQGKGHLCKLLVAQVSYGSCFLFLQQRGPGQLAVFSVLAGFICLAIGESGRRCNSKTLLRSYTVVASIAAILSVAQIITSNLPLQIRSGSFGSVSSNPEAILNGRLLISVVLQLYTIMTTLTLIGNMSVKRAS